MEEEKKKRGGKKRIDGCVNENQRMALEHFFWHEPVNLKNPDTTELVNRLEEFRDVYAELNVLPTWSDLANALQVNRSTLTVYRDGGIKCPEDVRKLLMKAHRWLEAMMVQFGLSNPLAQGQAIFLQKNYFNFRDSVDVNLAANQIPMSQSAEDVMARYKFIEASVVVPQLEEKTQAELFTDVVDAEVVEVETQEKGS